MAFIHQISTQQLRDFGAICQKALSSIFTQHQMKGLKEMFRLKLQHVAY